MSEARNSNISPANEAGSNYPQQNEDGCSNVHTETSLNDGEIHEHYDVDDDCDYNFFNGNDCNDFIEDDEGWDAEEKLQEDDADNSFIETLTSLPDIALVNIMGCLPLHDQYHMSITCHRLNELFYHPHLWHTMNIYLFGSTTNWFPASASAKNQLLVPKKYLEMIRKFGKFFQNLTLIINGFVSKFPKEWENILLELSKQCRLETLNLEIGKLTSYYHLDGYPPMENDLKAVLSFVQNASRLKTLYLKSWPMFPESMDDEKLNILSVIQQNHKLKDLENLSLFWCKATEWSERMPVLPSPEVTASLAIHFQNLHQLSLRSPMFDQHVLEALTIPGRTRLKLLQIFVHYSPTDDDLDFKIHEISSKTWQKFVSFNPEAQVECVILSRTPNGELSALLKPDCPLSAIKFMKYSRCDSTIITSLTDKFHKTLRSFVCYCETTCKDLEVISLVQKSKLLTKLIFHGPLHYQTVEVLAQLRGRMWQEFEMLGKSLHCKAEEGEDDDRVVAQGEDGAFYLVSLMRFHEEMSDDSTQDNMLAKVSDVLGYTWKPV